LKPPAPSSSGGSTALFSLARFTLNGIELRAQRTLDHLASDGATDILSADLSVPVYQEATYSTNACRLEVLQVFGGMKQQAGIPGYSPECALDLRLGSQRGRLNVFSDDVGAEASVDLGDFDLVFCNMSAELVAASVYSWMSAADDWRHSKRPSVSKNERMQRLVFGILRFSQSEGITTDPSFLNRVSYLVQSASRSLRFDDGWKILGHLRHCLRLMPSDKVSALKADMESTQRDTDSSEMFNESVAILSGWRNWEIEPDTLPRSSLLLRVFSPSEAKALETATFQPALVSFSTALTTQFTSGTFKGEFYEGGHSTNRLVVGPVNAVASMAPSRERRRVKIGAKLSVELVKTVVDPDLLHLMSHVARVRNLFEEKIKALDPRTAAKVSRPKPAADSSWPFDLDATVVIERFYASARAHGLEVTLSSQFLRAVVSLPPSMTKPTHMSHLPSNGITDVTASIASDTTELAVSEEKTRTAQTSSSPEEYSLLLASVGLESFNLQSSLSFTDRGPRARVICMLGALTGSAPRSLTRMHRLLEDWRSEELPKSRVLFDELKRDLNVRDTPSGERGLAPATTSIASFNAWFKSASVDANLHMPLASFRTRAMPSLWLEYTLKDTQLFAHSKPSGTPARSVAVDAGLQIASQMVQFKPALSEAGQPLPTEEGQTIAFPTVRISARTAESGKLHISSTIAAVTIKLSASVIDNVLAVQARFGHEIDELLGVLAAKRAKRSLQPGASEKPADRSLFSRMPWEASMALQGFKILVESPASVQYLEADLLNGIVEHGTDAVELSSLVWELSVTNLALSVAQRSSLSSTHDMPTFSNHKYRLAYFTTDFNVSNKEQALSELTALNSQDKTAHLHVRVAKVHAVMQSGAIDALGELIDHYTEEIRVRREERSKELKAIRQRVIQTLDISDAPAQPHPLSWIESCVFSLRASSIGIAIPLDDEEIEAPMRRSSKARRPRHMQPAFLVSAAAITFATSKGGAGFASVERFSLQFLSAFDQGKGHSFEGLNHSTLNRVLFPSMRCTVQPTTSDSKGRNFRIDSSVTGLDLDMDPSLVPYLFRLVDVYHLSQDRFVRLASQEDSLDGAADPTLPVLSTGEDRCPPDTRGPRKNSSRHISSVQATFEFSNGALRVHPRPRSTPGSPPMPRAPQRPPHRRGHSFADVTQFSGKPAGDTFQSSAPDIFNIPGLTVWAEYREEPSLEGEAATGEPPASLYIDALVHSSDNVLYPTILPTLIDIATEFKCRMNRSTTVPPPGVPLPATGLGVVPTPQAMAGFKLDIGLRINRSRLEISCLPITPVSASLSWQSGGFLLSLSPRQRGLTFVARVDDVGVDLRHTFSPEKCLGGNAKGLIVNVSVSKLEREEGVAAANFLSVMVEVLDVAGEINLRQIQDWLCLKMVWLDGIEKLQPMTGGSQQTPVHVSDSDSISHQSRMSTTSDASADHKAVLITAILVQVQRVAFSCNFGHSIGTTNATLSTFVGRLRLVPTELRSALFSFQGFEASSTGRLAGNIHLGPTVFQTTLRHRQRVGPPQKRVLDLEIRLGELMASLEFDYRKLLFADSDPILITIEDDWSGVSDASALLPQLVLAFSVKLGSLSVIMTTQTVPTLVKLTVDVEKLVDERRWKARNALSASPLLTSTTDRHRDTVSEVATKLAGKRNPSGPKVRINGRLHLEADRLRLVVFPRHFTDVDVFQAHARNVEARLVREENANGSLHRDLKLDLGSLSVVKLIKNPPAVTASDERQFTLSRWYERFNRPGGDKIFRMPSTRISMKSDQQKGSARLVHRCSMKYEGQVDITLNYALLKNLGDLVTEYQAGMRRVQSSGGEPVGVETASPNTGAGGGGESAEGQQHDRSPSAGGESKSPERVLQHVPEATASTFTMALPALPHSAPDQPRELEYVALANEIPDPQLTLLGDGTYCPSSFCSAAQS
jgi:hypothetical protein